MCPSCSLGIGYFSLHPTCLHMPPNSTNTTGQCMCTAVFLPFSWFIPSFCLIFFFFQIYLSAPQGTEPHVALLEHMNAWLRFTGWCGNVIWNIGTPYSSQWIPNNVADSRKRDCMPAWSKSQWEQKVVLQWGDLEVWCLHMPLLDWCLGIYVGNAPQRDLIRGIPHMKGPSWRN